MWNPPSTFAIKLRACKVNEINSRNDLNTTHWQSIHKLSPPPQRSSKAPVGCWDGAPGAQYSPLVPDGP